MFYNLSAIYMYIRGPGSSVGIATDYGLDGPGSNPGGDKIFCPSKPVLGPTQPLVQWVPGLSRGKVQPGHAADHSPPSSAVVMEEYSYNSTHPLGHIGPVTGSLYLFYICIYTSNFIHLHNFSMTNMFCCVYSVETADDGQ